jgi:hypothetical protein
VCPNEFYEIDEFGLLVIRDLPVLQSFISPLENEVAISGLAFEFVIHTGARIFEQVDELRASCVDQGLDRALSLSSRFPGHRRRRAKLKISELALGKSDS